MITVKYFIGTGKKSAMFTLWTVRHSDDSRLNQFMREHYLFNLAGIDNETAAIEKAIAYADAMRERIASDHCKVEFAGVWDEPTNRRRGKLSVRDTQSIELIEAGRFPFGKHVNTLISDAPDSYVLYWSDQMQKTTEQVAYTLAVACNAVALEKGLIAIRDAAKAARRDLDLRSQHVGTIGQRMIFSGEIVGYFLRMPNDFQDGCELTTVRTDDGNLVKFYNNEMGKVGDRVTFKATVKAHCEYQEIKSTRVNRPVKKGN